MATDPIPLSVLFDAMSDGQRAAWALMATALRRWAETDATYAVIPHRLSAVMGLPAYPLDHLAPVRDPEGRFCGLDGFHRDDLTGVDYWCLRPYAHELGPDPTPHGWEDVLGTDLVTLVSDWHAAGYRPELDDTGDELLDLLGDIEDEAGVDDDRRIEVTGLTELRAELDVTPADYAAIFGP
jgi:hypothetical protein